jgi:uncharacterized membrane protein YGL010W
MKSLADQLAQYAAYHRDSRNLITHMIGIPMIVVAVATLLSRPALGIAPLALSPAVLAAIIAAIFYLRLDTRFGIAMTLLLALSIWAGQLLAAQSTVLWLACGLGMFFIGWVTQFVGHYYEGRKPAFMDDLMGLAIGPLFIVAELGFLLGLRRDVRRAVEEKVTGVQSSSSDPRLGIG